MAEEMTSAHPAQQQMLYKTKYPSLPDKPMVKSQNEILPFKQKVNTMILGGVTYQVTSYKRKTLRRTNQSRTSLSHHMKIHISLPHMDEDNKQYCE